MNRSRISLICLLAVLFGLIVFGAYHFIHDKNISAVNNNIHMTLIGNQNDKKAMLLYNEVKRISPDTKIEWINQTSTYSKKNQKDKSSFTKPTLLICAEKSCSLPITSPEKIEKQLIYITKNTSNEKMINNSFLSNPSKVLNLITENNWWIVIPSFWVLGFLLALTPCILPLLIIITSMMGTSNEALDKKKAFLLATTYVLSLSTTYAIAGIVVSSFGFYLQGYMQSAWVIIIFSTFFALLGLSSLGFFNLQLPGHLRKSIFTYNKSLGGSYIGVALMGVFATLIASPCIAAPVTGLLAYVTQSGNVTAGAITLFSMGLGIGTPLIVISTIGSGLLQKSGKWQHYIKKFFGLVLLCIAVWLVKRVITDQQTLLLWAALAIFAGIYMGALVTQNTSPNDSTNRSSSHVFVSLSKTVSLMILIYGIGLIFGAFIGNTDPLRPLSKQSSVIPILQAPIIEFSTIDKFESLERVLRNAKTTQEPILLFFTAPWCTACKNLETNIFPSFKVQQAIKNFIAIRVDISKVPAEKINRQFHFNIIGPPTIIFIDKNGDVSPIRFDGEMDIDTLISALNTVYKESSR